MTIDLPSSNYYKSDSDLLKKNIRRQSFCAVHSEQKYPID